MSGDQKKKRRLFIGTFLSESDQASLAELQSYDMRLCEYWHRKVRFVQSQKLHLTWQFLGNVEELRITEICKRLDTVASRHVRLDIAYTKVQLRPSRRSARLLILAPEAVPPLITKLAGDIRSALAEFAERKESRPYSPHITLMRFGDGSGRVELPEWFCAKLSLPLRQEIRQIQLIESNLNRGADAYHVLHTSLFNG